MNSLSWLLYVADVAVSLRTFLVIGGVVAIGIGLVAWLGWTVSYVTRKSVELKQDKSPYEEKELREWTAIEQGWAKSRGFAIVGIISVVIGCTLPSQNTVLAIAASELGERAIKTEMVNDAYKAVHQWIKKQLEMK